MVGVVVIVLTCAACDCSIFSIVLRRASGSVVGAAWAAHHTLTLGWGCIGAVFANWAPCVGRER